MEHDTHLALGLHELWSFFHQRALAEVGLGLLQDHVDRGRRVRDVRIEVVDVHGCASIGFSRAPYACCSRPRPVQSDEGRRRRR